MSGKKAKNRGLLSAEARDIYIDFLCHPTITATARNGFSQSQQCNLKIRVLKNFELQGGRYLYRRLSKGFSARYADGVEEDYWIIANCRSQLNDVGVRQTFGRVAQM